jgi:hypothetical protein
MADRTPGEFASVVTQLSPKCPFVLKGSSKLLQAAASRKKRPEDQPQLLGLNPAAVSFSGNGSMI